MEIHDTTTLVQRAHEHHRQDHRISQGTYGLVTERDDGPAKFRGCQIACLSLPGDPVALGRFLKGLRDATPGEFEAREYAIEHVGDGPGRQLERLEAQFGIVSSLARLGEFVFENCLDPQPARDFVVEYAEALHDGAMITVPMVTAFHSETLTAVNFPSLPMRGRAEGEVFRDRTLTWLNEQRAPALL